MVRFNEGTTNFPEVSSEIELANLALKLSRLGKPLRFRVPSNLAVTLKISMVFEFLFSFWKCGLIVLNYDFVFRQYIYQIGGCFNLIWVRRAYAVEKMAD